MHKLNFDDTIAAISTPLGESGIGIVRLSGKEAVKIADKIFLPKNGIRPSQYRSFTMHYGHIVDGFCHGKRLPAPTIPLEKSGPAGKAGLAVNGKCIIDEVLLSIMRAPHTYTREDIAEINCHGGIAPLRKVLELAIRNGARLAQPGEFTMRAFLNGRLDLAQAEAVADIVKAKTEKSLGLACQQLKGRFSEIVRSLKNRLLNVYAELEAEVDFCEEGLEFSEKGLLIREIRKIKERIDRLLENAEKGIILKEGISVVICGRPNAGKSSLMNILLDRNRCLVTPVPGTTRDTIEEWANIEGIPLRLIDTAGITKAKSFLVKEAIKRSEDYLRMSDLVLLTLDGSREFSREDERILNTIREKNKIILVNKNDLAQKMDIAKIKNFFPKERIFEISCLTRKGIDKLAKGIRDSILGGEILESEGYLVTNLRHKEALLKTKIYLGKALETFKNKLSLEFVVLDLKESIDSLGEILGETASEDVLEKIFSRFCIGK